MKYVNASSYFANPFLVSALTFGAASVGALLPWSDFYPSLGVDLALFLIFTIGLHLLLFLITKGSSATRWLGTSTQPRLKYVLLVATVLFVANVLYPEKVPLIAGLTGDYAYTLKSIELLPVGYPLASAFFFFQGCQFFYYFLNSNQRKYLLLFGTFLLFHIVFVQRGFVVSQLATAGIMALIRKGRISRKHMSKGVAAVVVIVLLFGWLGELRDSSGKYYRPIEAIGGASQQFEESKLPSNVFYLWLYFTSPLANFQSNVNCAHPAQFSDAAEDFVLTEIIPDVFAKRVADTAAIEAGYRDCRIAPSLNVGTMYARAYVYLGWLGCLAIFFVETFVLLLVFGGFYVLRRRQSPYLVFAIAYSSVFAAMSVFDNMVPNSARMLPLVLPFIAEAIRSSKKLRLKAAV